MCKKCKQNQKKKNARGEKKKSTESNFQSKYVIAIQNI